MDSFWSCYLISRQILWSYKLPCTVGYIILSNKHVLFSSPEIRMLKVLWQTDFCRQVFPTLVQGMAFFNSKEWLFLEKLAIFGFFQIGRVGNTDGFNTCLPPIAAKVELFDHNTRKKKEGRIKLCQSILVV